MGGFIYPDILNKGCVVSSNLVGFVIGSFRACALETIRIVMIVCPSTPVVFGEGRPRRSLLQSRRDSTNSKTYMLLTQSAMSEWYNGSV